MSKKVLMVVTNHTKITDDHKTGLWLEEYAVPYNAFKDQGYEVKVTSIQGGEVPLDPNSIPEEEVKEWAEAQAQLKDTAKLSKEDANGFDGIFLPGGHGTMFDFPENETLQYVLQQHAEQNNVIGSVCHGPSGLVHATYENGTPIVSGKKVTGFTDSEEIGMGLDVHMPFMLETELRNKGGEFSKGDDWSAYAVRDGNLVTGQNPMSSEKAAEKMVEALKEN
ncbi:type 1 glutamine amidotransferase domain-containing protein [Halobacillus kuroshimensis]|uniref:Type 1 glutamine amidotransferase domain-containing protein n=1 Tax=Halobacillus kuroshimensis TaxID=302481 RepID=A0ABS3DRB1_9BACI|nr:type 1 glutamine amidotransferase domain-containing protein [Halobacillus kuroshimensis]MBN8233877.1 type 1 glutamine amidotransferase domain-containing protein [Halobacillus kuroshimensis]